MVFPWFCGHIEKGFSRQGGVSWNYRERTIKSLSRRPFSSSNRQAQRDDPNRFGFGVSMRRCPGEGLGKLFSPGPKPFWGLRPLMNRDMPSSEGKSPSSSGIENFPKTRQWSFPRPHGRRCSNPMLSNHDTPAANGYGVVLLPEKRLCPATEFPSRRAQEN